MADCSTPFPPRTKATDWASSILINISQFLGGKKGSGSALDWLICRSSHYDLKDIWKKPFPHNNYPSFLVHGYTYRFLQDLSRMAGHSSPLSTLVNFYFSFLKLVQITSFVSIPRLKLLLPVLSHPSCIGFLISS